MRAQSLIRIAVVVPALAGALLCALPCAQTPARAQGAPSGRPVRYRPQRIVVTPRAFHNYNRACTAWLALQRRPSGEVLFPQYRCWWEGQ